MSLIASLVRAYERLPDRPPFGCSVEKIGLLVTLHPDGGVANVIDLRLPNAKGKLQPRALLVPQPIKRASGIAPNFLWDKTAYSLGVTAGEGKRTAEEHAAFVQRHEEALAGANDEGLQAFVAFLRGWSPDQFQPPVWKDEYKDENVVFALERERHAGVFLYDRPAAQRLLAAWTADDERPVRICLASGDVGPIARLHASVKGVRGAQSAGASLISFNCDAFASYGHDQGDNAQIGERAAFAYTTALNRFLARDSGHSLQIGDAATVFWADAADSDAASLAEKYFGQMIDPARLDEVQKQEEIDIRLSNQQIHDRLQRLARGAALEEVEPKLADGVRFYVVGLAPNAARLSVRFYFEDSFGVLAENYRAYRRDIALEPQPPKARVSIGRFAACTSWWDSQKQKFDLDSVSPLLVGELLRAMLTGGRFPRSLLSTLLMRVRSDGRLDFLRASFIKAILRRDERLAGKAKEDRLMRSDPNDDNPARRLGRLFAVIERAQSAALGDRLNVTVADKLLGAASATPRQVMPALILNAQSHHIKRLRNGHSDADWIKDAEHARKMAFSLHRDIGRLVSSFNDAWPEQFSAEEQGLFLIGYYQERWGQGADDDESAGSPNEETDP